MGAGWGWTSTAGSSGSPVTRTSDDWAIIREESEVNGYKSHFWMGREDKAKKGYRRFFREGVAVM